MSELWLALIFFFFFVFSILLLGKQGKLPVEILARVYKNSMDVNITITKAIDFYNTILINADIIISTLISQLPVCTKKLTGNNVFL